MTSLVIIFTICLLGFVNTFGLHGLASDAEFQKKVEELTKKCKAEVGATDDDVKDLLYNEPAKSHEAKCLHRCVMKALNLVDKSGNLRREEFLEYTKEYYTNNKTLVDINMKVFDNCGKIKQTECEAAEEFRICMKTEAKKAYENL